MVQHRVCARVLASGIGLHLAVAAPEVSQSSVLNSETSAASTAADAAIELQDRSRISAITWKTPEQVPVWKTIRLGTFANINLLREALMSAACSLGPLTVSTGASTVRSVASRQSSSRACHLGLAAGEIIGRPGFRLSRNTHEVDLVMLTPIELGFAEDQSITLEDIHDRAELLGFQLCPAEVGPQLRLQYLDQPLGEFLHIAMLPIATYNGEATDFTVGNGGEGLMLVGGDGRPDVLISAISRFVFVRPRPERP